MEIKKFGNLYQCLAVLNNGKKLLHNMLQYRMGDGLLLDEAITLLQDKERIFEDLVNYGVIVEVDGMYCLSGTYEEVFSTILRCNTKVHPEQVGVYITDLTRDISYFLIAHTANDRRRYFKDIRKTLQRIVESSQSSALRLKDEIDFTYKNERDIKLKKQKLDHMQIDRKSLADLINSCIQILNDNKSILCAQDESIILVINDTKRHLQEVIEWLLGVDEILDIFAREFDEYDLRRKKLRVMINYIDTHTVEQKSNINELASECSDRWLFKNTRYSTWPDLDGNIATEVAARIKFDEQLKAKKSPAKCAPLRKEEMEVVEETEEYEDLDQIRRDFQKGTADLYNFLMNYKAYKKEHDRKEIIDIFCQLCMLYDLVPADTDEHRLDNDVEYMVIKPFKLQ